MSRGELVGPDSPAWSRALETLRHDVYHLPAWTEVEAARQGHRPVAFLFEDRGRRFLLPLLMQEIPGSDRRDCASPYGYPGPLADPEAGRGFLEAAGGALVESLRDRGVVAAFVRLHPLLSPPPELLGRHGTTVHHGDTVAIDLHMAEERIWSETRSGHRNEINRARRHGFEVLVGSGGRLDDFVRLYHRTMERVGADRDYFFSSAYFRSLEERLAGRLHLAVVSHQAQVACAALFFETGRIVQYHLSGTDDDFLGHHPTKLLLDEVRLWARQRNNDWLHLGGGLGGRNDQLFQFKAGFSRRRFPFATWRLVVDPQAYAKLTRARGSADPEATQGFFPAYRGG